MRRLRWRGEEIAVNLDIRLMPMPFHSIQIPTFRHSISRVIVNKVNTKWCIYILRRDKSK